MRVQSGCLILGDCYLITLTYKTARDEPRRRADSVRADFNRWCRQMKKWYPRVAWMKVVEMTKKSQPHLHLVVGGIGKPQACHTGKGSDKKCIHKWNAAYRDMRCDIDCLEHRITKLWYRITGDSYVTDCREVTHAKGAGSYIGKYLAKGFDAAEFLKREGFARRWARSRNWPVVDKLQLEATTTKSWSHTDFIYKGRAGAYLLAAEASDDDCAPLAKRVGSRMAFANAEKLDRKRKIATINTFMKGTIHEDNRPQALSAPRSD